MNRIITVLVCLTLFGAVNAIAGSIGYKQIRRHMDWEPDCYKPSVPSFYASDVDSYNMAVHEFNSYLSEVETYLGCIRTEGEADLRLLSRAIENGIEEKRSEIIGELESAKSDLSYQRSTLQ